MCDVQVLLLDGSSTQMKTPPKPAEEPDEFAWPRLNTKAGGGAVLDICSDHVNQCESRVNHVMFHQVSFDFSISLQAPCPYDAVLGLSLLVSETDTTP